jgi:hypothetical protein
MYFRGKNILKNNRNHTPKQKKYIYIYFFFDIDHLKPNRLRT